MKVTIIKFLIMLTVLVVGVSCSNDLDMDKDIKNTGVLEGRSIDNPGTIKPDHKTQDEINQDVYDYYYYWKNTHVRESNWNTPGGGYYVYMQGTGGNGEEITTSEAHGYGMMIFVLMGDKEYFDGMFNMFDKHRSTSNPNNMSWVIHYTEDTKYDEGSAADGDMDVAYALLLAHDMWGSSGNINYLKEAKQIITYGIKVSDMNTWSKRVMMGDFDTDPYSTRASDWMVGHLRAYYNVTGDSFWLEAADEIYYLIDSITQNYSPWTGLMPDFIVEDYPQPAPQWFLNEYQDTNQYMWNSCRYPWRITVDYAHHGTPEAKAAMKKTMDWLTWATDYDPANIKSGYNLDGSVINDFFNQAFAAPFITAAITDPSYQYYLNSGWEILNNSYTSYYGDSINLLCMLLISGNWWAPGGGDGDDPDPDEINLAYNKSVYASGYESGSTLYPENINDGNWDTRWASPEDNNSHWVSIDLGSVQDFNKVVLHWEAAYAKSYDINISNDGNNWTTIKSVTNGEGGWDPHNLVNSARYVGFYFYEKGTNWGYSLYEIEVLQ